MKRLNEKTICMIRQIYTKGTRLELKRMDAPPSSANRNKRHGDRR